MASLKAFLAKPFAAYVASKISKWSSQPIKTQQKVFKQLIKQAQYTAFGNDHNFNTITTHTDFVNQVPIRDYEALKPYIERAVNGEPNVLWKDKPLYFAKTSGTTSGSKYIPITKQSMPTHIEAARNAILMYIHQTGRTSFVDGKMIFLQGSPVLQQKHNIKRGRLSGIVAHYVPKYLQKNRMPSYTTNCIEDWEQKVDAIVEETWQEDMRVISGIPSWVQMYFERLIEKSNQPVGELFKAFSLFIYGGVNFEPYRSKFKTLIGRDIDSIELYPASEGFFAFQDNQNEKGMLLQLNSGIFYEFVEAQHFFKNQPKRITIEEVEIGVNYVMIVSTTAGLWAYNVGDTVQFTSIQPYRVIVSGRIKHFISAFGEHVIGKEVEQSLKEAITTTKATVNEFTVAPQINPEEGLPYHEWLIEFEELPKEMSEFISVLEEALQAQNSYYLDLIKGKVLQPLKVSVVQPKGFQTYMKSIGKLGGQNKVPRLSNDRTIADTFYTLDLLK